MNERMLTLLITVVYFKEISRFLAKAIIFLLSLKYIVLIQKKNNINPFQAKVPLIEKPTKWMIITSKMFEKRQWKSDI